MPTIYRWKHDVRWMFCLIALVPPPAAAWADALPALRLSPDGKGFVAADGQPFEPWGFNYLGRHGELAEETWDKDWERIETDLREMRKLGANVVRWHLQLSTFMTSAEQADAEQLARLRRLLDLAQENGLYLDLTGLSCYRLAKVPAWYGELPESDRWQVQARFWRAIAQTCADHPAVFCYDLMNEPVVNEPKAGQHPWLAGELGGLHFVQRISNKLEGRTNVEIAAQWVELLVGAIREHDREHLVTVGVIPWAQTWPGAKPIFYAPAAAEHLDFVSIHVYPESGKIDRAVNAVKTYDVGKPIVIEEIYPLSCGVEQLDEFMSQVDPQVDGWISHYFGKTIDEHRAAGTLTDAIHAAALQHWRDKRAADAKRDASQSEAATP